jgi:hypothetical protein
MNTLSNPLTTAQLAHYDEHGYVIVRRVFAPELAARLLERIDGLLPGVSTKRK